MKKYIIGNWKLNKNLTEVADFVDGVKVKLKKVEFEKDLEVVLCPSYPYLLGMADLLEGSGIRVGSQDVSQFDEGTFTGEVSAKMLSEIVKYVIIGHSERRKHFQENLEIIRKKLNKVLTYNLNPIVCLSDKVWGNGLPAPKYVEKYFLNQISFLMKGMKKEEKEKIIFVYEPPSAISRQKKGDASGQAASLNRVIKMVEKIKEIAPRNRVLYGGSVKTENADLFMNQEIIDGVLVGSASLEAQDFAEMIQNSLKVLHETH